MICFERFAICDMPKTGGFFIRKAFDVISRERRSENHTVFEVNVPKYVFVRSPLSWYSSYISFVKYGSTDDRAGPCLIANALGVKGRLRVETYINACLGNDSEVRAVVAAVDPLVARNNIQRRIIDWARSDTKDLYSWMIEYFSVGAVCLRHEELTPAVLALSEKYQQPILEEVARSRASVTLKKVLFPDDFVSLINEIPLKNCVDVKDI